ncbi:MAG: SpoIIE family protein phosphatase [Bacteroidota bacterium]|nr:SpoIIE family protein phosphatase [Bacteroidota bacterium]MDP4191125.1 SpoIIE family protein phosphatase [Bacteroidota bacterium]MDP4193469.1 SpoIIE family protein phosphatase [Bacteroidota bacterium]
MSSLKTYIQKNRQKIIIVLTAILAVYGFIALYFIVEVRPVSNDECLWLAKELKPDSTVIYFDKVKVGGVSWNAGIRNGDYLLEINNVRIKDLTTATIVLNRVRAGNYAKYLYEHNGRTYETEVYVKKLVSYGNLAFALLALIWLAVGFIVIMAKPNGYVQRLFFRIGMSMILFLSFVFIPNMKDPRALGLSRIIVVEVFDTFWTFGSIFFPFFLMHFFLEFPKPYKIMEKKWVKRLIYTVPSVLFALTYLGKAYLLIIHPNPGVFNKFVQSISYSPIIGYILGLILLLISFIRLKDPKERKPIFVIVVSYILGVLAIIYSLAIVNVIADTIFNSPELFTPIILIAIIPVAFAYSIFKYQLMDVSVVVKNTIIYGTATIAIAAIYFLTVYGLGQSIGSFIGTEYRNAIAAVSFVVFAMVFQSTKDKFQDLLTRKFYPEQFAYQRVILKFGSDVVSIVGLDNILDSMNETFVKSLNLKQFAILMAESKTASTENGECKFNLVRGTGVDDNLCISDSKMSLTHFVREKITLKMPLSIEQQEFSTAFPEQYEKLSNSEIFTITPMIIKSKVIGLLCFGLKRSGSQFSGKDLEILCAAANQAAVSIENARLYESEAQKLAFERDLENARKIQESLLPKSIPEIAQMDIAGIMTPAMQVGGDYFDIIKVSPSRVFVLVGDVSGKGLSASLYMSKLQTMMRLYCQDGKSPKEVLVEVNRRIYESIERNWFITLNLALFDTERKTVKFCRAGHSPLLLLCGNEMSEYQPKGIGLGLEVGKIFSDTLEEIEIGMETSQTYAFYSDGVSEAMNKESELFGVDRLTHVISENQTESSQMIIGSIMNSLESFRDGREQNDDITMVLIKT